MFLSACEVSEPQETVSVQADLKVVEEPKTVEEPVVKEKEVKAEKEECHKELIEVSESSFVLEKYDIKENGTNHKGDKLVEVITKKNISKEVCPEEIILEDEHINYVDKGYNCEVSENETVCDSFKDGNGDGICQSGETCVTIKNNKITYLNGESDIVLMKKLK